MAGFGGRSRNRHFLKLLLWPGDKEKFGAPDLATIVE
jgi:hypothetical protein